MHPPNLPGSLHAISQRQLTREARLHAQLCHPNIIKMYAAFQEGDDVVLVLEHANAEDLLVCPDSTRR